LRLRSSSACFLAIASTSTTWVDGGVFSVFGADDIDLFFYLLEIVNFNGVSPVALPN
jgi:hypothetical protein